MSVTDIRPSWARIDLEAIRCNIRTMKAMLSGQTAIMAVVKANGYGHGTVEVALASLEAGATWLGVATLGEAIELRHAGVVAPILILGYTPETQAEAVVEGGISQSVWTGSMIRAMVDAGRRLGREPKMQIKMDTGMSRLGAREGDEVRSLIACLRDSGCDSVDGAFTHFPVAEADPAFTEHQFASFMRSVEEMRAAGLSPGLLHCCNSAALIKYPEYHLDAVRPGIALYGYPPVPAPGFHIALTLKSRLAHVKSISEGTKVGYGCTYTAARDMVIGTIPVGYADGYSRHLSSLGVTSMRGKRAPIIGRVCMDQTMIDLSEAPEARPGDEVTLIAGEGETGPTAEHIAAWTGTIVNDVLTAIGPRVPRVYHSGSSSYLVESGKRVEILDRVSGPAGNKHKRDM